jgi:hypothetical protein
MPLGGKLAILILSFYAIACSSLMVDKNTHDYPQASKDLFVSSCVKSGGNQEQCTCVLGKVQEKYTYGEVEELEKKINAGTTPPEFNEFMQTATQACKSPGSSPAAPKSKQPV